MIARAFLSENAFIFRLFQGFKANKTMAHYFGFMQNSRPSAFPAPTRTVPAK